MPARFPKTDILARWTMVIAMFCCGITAALLVMRHARSIDKLVDYLTPDQQVRLTLTPRTTLWSYEAYTASRTVQFDTTDVRYLLNLHPGRLQPTSQSWQCSLGGSVTSIQFEVLGVSDDIEMLALADQVSREIARRRNFNPQDPGAMSVNIDGFSRLTNLRWKYEYKSYCRYFAGLVILPGLLLLLSCIFRHPRHGFAAAVLCLLGLIYFSSYALGKFNSNTVSQFANADLPYLIFTPQPTTLPVGNWQPGHNWQMNYDDIETIIREYGSQLYFLSPFNHTNFLPLQGTAGSRHAEVMGITPDFWQTFPVRQVYGRFINAGDLENHGRYCILGSKLSETLFGAHKDPSGEFVLQDGVAFEVIGVISNTNPILNPGTDIDYTMFIPITTDYLYYSHDRAVSSFVVIIRNPELQETVTEQIRQRLYSLHSIDGNDVGALNVINVHEQLASYSRWARGVRTTLIMTIILSIVFACAIIFINYDKKHILNETII